MPKICNEVVQLNDIVHDLTCGRGQVVGVTNETIEVAFDSGRRLTFNQYGQIDGIRRLFWQYPILIDPPKDINAWEKFVNVIKAIHKLVNS